MDAQKKHEQFCLIYNLFIDKNYKDLITIIRSAVTLPNRTLKDFIFEQKLIASLFTTKLGTV